MARHVTSRQQIASANLSAQRDLFEALRQAREAAGKDVEAAAAELGITGDELVEIEAGRVDLTLGELRELAYAVEAIVRFDIQSDHLEAHREVDSMIVQIETYLAEISFDDAQPTTQALTMTWINNPSKVA